MGKNTPQMAETAEGVHPLKAEKQATPPCRIVAVGASAGGQEALEQIFTALPTGCNLAIVVIMHLPAEGPAFLAEMLQRYTPMPVVTAKEGEAPQPDTVHVFPAGKELILHNGLFQAGATAERHRGFHPIDRFCRSLAAEAGERTVAVILSGYGTDGVEGVQAIKAAGGVVIVQEPGSALAPAMPRSAIATGAADLVMPTEKLAEAIAGIARGTCLLPAQACRTTAFDEDLAAIFALVRVRTGHDFSTYKRSTVIRRIERRMAVNDVAGMKKYLALLEVSEQEARALGQEILIGVTSFFRDPEAFAVLRREILPRLFTNRDPANPVRIWHACCATGEEVYSNAILIREYLDEQRLDARVQIFATDIDDAAIAQARAGVYGDDIVAEVDREQLETFFTRADGRWQVAKRLREMVVFAHHSLIKDPPFSRIDLLVCRNFLIYLNPDMQQRLLTLFHQALKPRGVLFLGTAESVGRTPGLFSPISKKWRVYERLAGSRREGMFFPFTVPASRFSRVEPSAAEPLGPQPRTLAEKLLLERYAPPCILVNEKYEVIHLSTRAQRLLEVPEGEPTRNILEMAREELRPALRAAIYKAFAEQQQVAFRGVRIMADGEAAAVNVLAEPLRMSPPAEKLAAVILEAAPLPAPLPAPSDGEGGSAGDESSKDLLIRQLEEQLRVTHEQLQAATELLETSQEGFITANEELLSINEEFQSANEELQSTNEELETSKEELQALNEELATVNAELQGKVEELDRANGDMENLFRSSEVATIFLDRQLIIRRFSPTMAGIFNLIAADIGRPFRHLAGILGWAGLPEDVRTVLATLAPLEREMATQDGERHYLMRMLPYRTTEGHIDGVAATLIEITERKRAEEQIRSTALFPEENPFPILRVAGDGTLAYANRSSAVLLAQWHCAVGDTVPELVRRELAAALEIGVPREMEVRCGGRELSFMLVPISARGYVNLYGRDLTERKQAEAALKRSKERLKRAQEIAHLGSWELDLLDNSLIWSDEVYRIFGLEPQEFEATYEAFLAAVHPEDRQAVNEAYSKSLREGRDTYELEHRVVRKATGEIRYVHEKCEHFRDETGRIVRSTGMVHDVTERWLSEKALRKSEERVRHKLESIISPGGDIGDLELADIIDAAALQSLVDDFYVLTRLPMGLIDLKGQVLVGVGWQDVCTKFHRIHPETCQNCIESDVQLSAGVPRGEYKIYRCKNNMWDVATPINVGDRHFGNLFMGQFFFEDEPIDYELFRTQAREYGFDEEGYIAALEAVPRLSRETLNTSMSFFMKLADLLSRLSYSNIQLARSLTERELILESLRVSEDQFRRAIEEAPIPVIIHAEDGEVLQVSRTWSELTGYSKRDLPTLDVLLDTVFAEGAISVRDHLCELFRENRRSIGAEFPVHTRDGRIRHWSFSVSSPGMLQDGRRFVVGMAEDVTERKQAEERQNLLAETASLLLTCDAPQKVVDTLCRKVMTYLCCQIFLNFLVDEQQSRLRLNASAGIMEEEKAKLEWLDIGEAICGCVARDACRIVVEDLPTNPDPRTALVKSYGIRAYACHPLVVQRRVLGTLSFGTRTKDRFSEDDLVLMKAVADHVAIAMERKQVEEALRESELFSRQTLASIPGMVFTTRPDGYCDFQSQQWVDFTGVPMSEHLGDGWNRLLHPDDRPRAFAAWRNAVEERAPYDLEYRVRRHDDEYEWFKVRGRPIRNEAGEIVRWFGTALNIDQLVRTQEELRRATAAAEVATRAKSEFLANMSHEIRTPMTVFMAAIEHLLQIDDNPERHQLLEMADVSARRLRALIDDILDLSRIEAHRVELEDDPFDLRRFVQEVVEMFALPASEKQLCLEAAVADDTPEIIIGDRNRLGQVLANLIGNAVKFTEEGTVRVAVRPRDTFLEFSVVDTGIGIPEEKRHLLFQRFSQTDPSFNRRYGGSGLGLSICRGLVELMGGRITVQDGDGGGSDFTFTLPLKPLQGRDSPLIETLSEINDDPLSAVRILLVDDEPMICAVIAMMLDRRGWQVEIAGSGREAVTKWEGGTFDVLLMDLQMPVMNGLEATKVIRAKEADRGGRRTCIIALTAHARREIVDECLQEGMDRVLIKPVKTNDLYAAIEAGLSG